MLSLLGLKRGSDSFLRRHLRAERYALLEAYLREQNIAPTERRGGPSVWSAAVFERDYKLSDLRPAAEVILGPQPGKGPVKKAAPPEPKAPKGKGAKVGGGYVAGVFSEFKKALFVPRIKSYPHRPTLVWDAFGYDPEKRPSPI